MIRFKNLFFILLIHLSHYSLAQPLTAQVDRSELAPGEAIQLTLSLSNQDTDSEPELKHLHDKFIVIGTAKTTQLSITNGHASTTTQWQLHLLPKQTGKIVIPAIRLGHLSTQPLTIQVNQTPTKSLKNPQQASIFLEAESLPQQPYVQSQVLYTVKLYLDSRLNLQEGNLTDPILANALLIRLGEDQRYQATKQGKNYEVIERRYAIFPQYPGKTAITGPSLLGQIAPATHYATFSDWMTPNNTIHLTANKVALNVQSKPNNYPLSQPWLPAQQVTALETWSHDLSQISVGEPVTRTLTLRAIGLTGEQLPHLTPVTQLTGLNSYTAPVTTNTRIHNNHVLGEKIFKTAMIATQAGDYHLPASQIVWWNTQTQQLETIQLPAHQLKVVASTATNQHTSTTLLPKPVTTATVSSPASKSKAADIAVNPKIIWVLGVSLLLGLIGYLGWWLIRKQQPNKSSKQPSTNSYAKLQTIKTACQTNNAQLAQEALLAWASCRWPDKPILTLGQLNGQIAQSEFKQAIKQLEQTLYAHPTVPWQGQGLWSALQLERKQAKAAATSKPNDLPPLYPT